MRMTLERFIAVIDAASECLDAYERLANAMTDLATSSDVPGDIARMLDSVSLRPKADAILLLGMERKQCQQKRDTVDAKRDAVKRCRERKRQGFVVEGRRPVATWDDPHAIAGTHEGIPDYEAIARGLQEPTAEPPEPERPAKVSVILKDSTPETGTDLKF